MNLAPSTVAMSIYNVLAIGGPMDSNTIASTLYQFGFKVRTELIGVCLTCLLNRSYVKPPINGRFAVAGPARKVVRWRDRSGDGWGGWKIMDDTGLVPLDAVVGG